MLQLEHNNPLNSSCKSDRNISHDFQFDVIHIGKIVTIRKFKQTPLPAAIGRF